MDREPDGAVLRASDPMAAVRGQQHVVSGSELDERALDFERRAPCHHHDPLVVILVVLDRVGAGRADDALDACARMRQEELEPLTFLGDVETHVTTVSVTLS